MTRARAWRTSILAAVLAVTGASACAYYNTLYNAKSKFEEAEKADPTRDAAFRSIQQKSQGDDLVNPQAREYEAVITKCEHVIARYPDSKHVDDSMLLIARSLYRLNKFEEAAAALDSLESRFPKTNLLPDARFLKGKSLVAAEKYDAAEVVLNQFVDTYRKNGRRPEALYLLCVAQMEMGLSDNAVKSLARLEEDHGRSSYRFRAQVDMAHILAEKELYQESLAVYRRLNQSRIPEGMRFDVWVGMARVQESLGDHTGALATLEQARKLVLTAEREPVVLLLSARALAGADSTQRAINRYKSVATRYSRGVYGAEANFRLGELYEAQDSLRVAQKYYQDVPRSYSQSEFAEEAIRRSSDIGRVLKIEEAAGDDSPEAVALRTFAMAEVQLFQFENTEKAIPNYEKIVNEFGDSEYAPRAAYALGYIYGVVRQDSVKAREWYEVLRTRYPESQQTLLASAFYRGAVPPPPLSDMMRFAKARPISGAQPGQSDAGRSRDDTGGRQPVVNTQPAVAPALPDSLRDPEPIPMPVPATPDTTR